MNEPIPASVAGSSPAQERRSRALRCYAVLLACGVGIGLIGDHGHILAGVTAYRTSFGPLWIGETPLWFVLLVAPSVAGLGVLQGWLAARAEEPDPGVAPAPWAFASPLLVLALYLTTSLYPWRDGGSLELIMTVGAALLWLGLDRTKRGLAIGLAFAALATATERLLIAFGWFVYLPGSDELFGVAPSLLPLYFSASVAVGAVGRRMIAK